MRGVIPGMVLTCPLLLIAGRDPGSSHLEGESGDAAGTEKGGLKTCSAGSHRARPGFPKRCSATLRRDVLLPECLPTSCVSTTEAVSTQLVVPLLDAREQCPRDHKIR